MPSTGASAKRYREKLKQNEPEKYQEMLQKARERSKRNRDAKKLRWASEPQTRGLLQEIENFKGKERQRWRKYYAKEKAKKKPASRTTRTSLQADANCTVTPSKRPRDMDPEEKREHKRKLQQLCRQRETPKKTWWRRKKDRERKQEKRAEKKMSGNCSNPPPDVCSPVKKSEYNLLSSIRRKLAPKKPSKFARLLKNLASNKLTQEQAQAVSKEGLLNKHYSHKVLKEKIAAARRRFKVQSKKPRKVRLDALSEETQDLIRNFYFEEDISRALPSKRYATKEGPGYVMQQTLKQAYNLFKAEHPSVKVGYTKFTKMRPKNVRKISASFLDTCQCVYCVNVRFKVLAMNRSITRLGLDTKLKLEDERSIVNLLLCEKEPGEYFHKPECIKGVCQQCGDHEKMLRNHYEPLLEASPTLSWSKWDRGDAGREPVVVTACAEQLMDELVTDVVSPSRNSSFVLHLFTAHWQHYQYRQLKEKLSVGQVLVIMDFAENKKSLCQDEIKSAHFNKVQFSFHPVVAFYRGPDGDLVRHALDFVSDDIQHDCHAVHHFTERTIKYLTEQGVLHAGCQLFIFSDNCAAQYKNRGTFADLSHYAAPVQRLYFGAEHGKGEADGETGVVSRAIERAVLCRQVHVRGAEDFFTWCQDNLTKDSPKSKRHFEYVQSKDIKRDRQETKVKTVTSSSKFHQVVRVAPLVIKSRGLACFCAACWQGKFENCTNQAYVGQFQLHHIQPLEASHPEPPELPRKEFFASLQQELLQHKRNFGSFTATAQIGLRRAREYPLPFPVMEPEFDRDDVDEAAERQRPAGAAPPDHHARRTLGDGNCLARSLSAAVFGSEDYHVELRVRLAMELALRKYTYLSPEYGPDLLAFLHASGDFDAVPTLEMAYECEVLATVSNYKDMGLWHLLAAANVLGTTIHSIFPAPNVHMNKIITPDEAQGGKYPIYVQWTSTHDRPVDATWSANHVVPVVKSRHYVSNPDSLQVGDYVTADFVSTDGKVETYRAVVVPKPPRFPDLPDEVWVKCMRPRDNGRYFVFPNVDDVSSLPLPRVKKNSPAHNQQQGSLFLLNCMYV